MKKPYELKYAIRLTKKNLEVGAVVNSRVSGDRARVYAFNKENVLVKTEGKWRTLTYAELLKSYTGIFYLNPFLKSNLGFAHGYKTNIQKFYKHGTNTPDTLQERIVLMRKYAKACGYLRVPFTWSPSDYTLKGWQKLINTKS